MTTPQSAGYPSDNARTEGEMKQFFEDELQIAKEKIGGAAVESLTASAGAVTPTRAIFQVTSETGSADDLDTIAQTNHPDGRVVIVRATSGHTITVRDNQGNIQLTRDINMVLDSTTAWLMLLRDGSTWREIGRFHSTLSALQTFVGISTFGATLVDDTTASAARTTLGLGNVATQNAGEGLQNSGANLLLNVNGLTEQAGIVSGDFIPFYDVNVAGHRKVDVDDLVALAQTFTSESLAAEGYVVFANGLTIQWGETTTGQSGTETLPIAMSNNLWIVVATNERNSASPGSDEEIRVHSFTTTQFGWFHIQGTGPNKYIAIGN